MEGTFRTDRLLLTGLAPTDHAFIHELLNTSEWIRFIGNRNISDPAAAGNYIQKIIANPNVKYWVVKESGSQVSVGIITFIKREYLEHYDIGFAFLPTHTKKGFAYEATKVILDHFIRDAFHKCIHATTVKANTNSIKLLERLGLQFEKEIQVGEEQQLLFSISTDKGQLDKVTAQFFSIFTNTDGRQPDWKQIHHICIPEVIIIKKTELSQEVYTLPTFIEPRKKILSNGTLIDFEEYETGEETKIIGTIAQRFSNYEKKGLLNGQSFKEQGTKMFQFIKTRNGWKINAVVWEDKPPTR